MKILSVADRDVPCEQTNTAKLNITFRNSRTRLKTEDSRLQFFNVLLTVHLSIILVTDQSNAQIVVLS